MDVKLIVAAAIAAFGLAACAPDVTPEASSAPTQPAVEQQVVQAPEPAPAAQEAKKDEGAGSALAVKTDEDGKKAD